MEEYLESCKPCLEAIITKVIEERPNGRPRDVAESIVRILYDHNYVIKKIAQGGR
jgi:hypothetical protein